LDLRNGRVKRVKINEEYLLAYTKVLSLINIRFWGLEDLRFQGKKLG
jgi:hypothetical protein